MYSKSQSSSPKPIMTEYSGLPSSISAPSLLSLQKSSQPFKTMNSQRENKQSNCSCNTNPSKQYSRSEKNQRKNNNQQNSENSDFIRAQSSLCINNNQQPPQPQQQQEKPQPLNNNNHHRYPRNLQHQKKFTRTSIDNLSNLLDKSSISNNHIKSKQQQQQQQLQLQQQRQNASSASTKSVVTTPPKSSAASVVPSETTHYVTDEAEASAAVAEVAKKQSIDINPIVMDEESLKLYVPLLHVTAELIENRMDPIRDENDDDITSGDGKQTTSATTDINSSFNAESSPNITVFQYLRRILKYTMFDEEIFIITVIYLDRLKRLNPTFQLNTLNIHRLILTCALISSKYQNEKCLDNRYYAQVGGVSMREINILELKLLSLLNYNLFVYRDEFDQYLKNTQLAVDEYRRAQAPISLTVTLKTTNSVSPSTSPPPSTTTPPLHSTNNNIHNNNYNKPYRQKSNSYQNNNISNYNGQPLHSFVNTINKAKPFHNASYNTYPPPQYYNYHQPPPSYHNVEYQGYATNGQAIQYAQTSYQYPIYQPTQMYQQDLTTPPSDQNSHAWNYYYSQPHIYNNFGYPQYPN